MVDLTSVLVLCALLALAVWVDLISHRIPNALVVFGLLSALVWQLYLGQGLGNAFLGIVLGFACFIPLYALGGMAAGDVKLLMVVGGWVGYPIILSVAYDSVIVGALMALGMVVVKGRFGLLIKNLHGLGVHLWFKSMHIGSTFEHTQAQSVGRMPFAPAIAFGTLWALWESGSF